MGTIQLTDAQIASNVDCLLGLKNAETNISAMLLNDYALYFHGNSDAEKAIVAYWNACVNAGLKKKVTTQLSTASKQYHKDVGVKTGGVKVVDDKIVEAPTRAAKEAKNPLLDKAKELAPKLTNDQQKILAELLSKAADDMVVKS